MSSTGSLRPCVVLVADRTLSADYKILFEGIFATMQTTKVPELAMRHFVAPPVRCDPHGRAVVVPLGLRRVEATLVDTLGLSPDDVVCTTPECLPKLLGPWVKVVGVSSSDPMGHGMSNTTTTSFWSGQLYTKYWTGRMLAQLRRLKQEYGFQVVGGGAGAWQWMQYPDEVSKECIDVVYEGYFEGAGVQLFSDLLAGRAVPSHFLEEETCVEQIRPVRGGSLMGIIEVSRGCGRGCRFCSMAQKGMQHLPMETIQADLQTNLSAGLRSVVSGSEDFFRYGATGIKPDFEKLRQLLEGLRQVKGLSFMQIDHVNVTSVAQMTDAQLTEIRRLLTWESHSEYLWVNMGAESANGYLVAANCPGKVAPYRPDDWEPLLYATAERMTRNGYFGMFSLVLGLPGETLNDVRRTKKFVEYLQTQNAIVFPVFYEPVRDDEIAAGQRFGLDVMTPEHLELYRMCYEINFKKVPLLYWDNQRCGGVSWVKRSAIQLLGRGETRAWRRAFRRTEKKLKR